MRGYVPDASDSVISGTVRIVLKVIVEDPERYFNEGQSNRTTMRRSILGLPLSGERILSGRKRAERLTKSPERSLVEQAPLQLPGALSDGGAWNILQGGFRAVLRSVRERRRVQKIDTYSRTREFAELLLA